MLTYCTRVSGLVIRPRRGFYAAIPLRDYLKDNEAALAKAYELAVSEYGKKGRSGWEWKELYYKIALHQIDLTLSSMDAPLARWEVEYRAAYDPWGELGLDSPAISACESLINIYTQQNRPEAEIEALE